MFVVVYILEGIKKLGVDLVMKFCVFGCGYLDFVVIGGY